MGSIRPGEVRSIDFSTDTLRVTFFFSLFFPICLYALWKGAGPERSVATIYLSVWAFYRLVKTYFPIQFAEMDPGFLVIDLILWVGFFAVALRAERFWPLWVVSVQTISMVAHVTKLVDVSISPRAYYIMMVASSYPILIALAIGTYQHQRRLKTNGSDPSWRVK